MVDTLVVFFSRSGENYEVGCVEKGSGRIIADSASAMLGSPEYEIVRSSDYPASYEECSREAEKERMENARPALRFAMPSMDGVRNVILVYPNWWGDLPMPVYSFLDAAGMDGRRIYPICTHEGNGIGMTDRCLKQAYPGAEVMRGLALRGTVVQGKPDEAEAALRKYLSDSGFAL